MSPTLFQASLESVQSSVVPFLAMAAYRLWNLRPSQSMLCCPPTCEGCAFLMSSLTRLGLYSGTLLRICEVIEMPMSKLVQAPEAEGVLLMSRFRYTGEADRRGEANERPRLRWPLRSAAAKNR